MPPACTSRVAAIVLALVSCVGTVRAQADVDPIEFDYEYPRIGGELGLMPTWQSGTYISGCGEFVEGAGLNPIIALAYDRPLGDGEFRLELLAGWQSRTVTSTFNRREAVVLQIGSGTAVVDVDFENEATLWTGYVFAMPSAKFYPIETFYVGAGPIVGLLTGATSQYRKTIVTKSVLIPEVGLSEISYPEAESSEPYTKIFETEERPDKNSLSFDIGAYVGAEFPLGERMKIGPRLLYAIPLSAALSNPDLKLNTIQLTIGVRYSLFR